MWIITTEPILFNTDTGSVIDFGWSPEVKTYAVYLNDKVVHQCDTAAEALAFIDGLAALLGAASVPMPAPEPDGKPDPF